MSGIGASTSLITILSEEMFGILGIQFLSIAITKRRDELVEFASLGEGPLQSFFFVVEPLPARGFDCEHCELCKRKL